MALATIACASLFLKNYRSVVLVGIAAIALGFCTVARSVHVPDDSSIERFAPAKNATLTGVIIKQPDDRQTKMDYLLRVQTIQATLTGAIVPAHGHILITDKSLSCRFGPGDIVMIRGNLKLPFGDNESSYKNYLALSSVYATFEVRSCAVTGFDHHFAILRTLWKLRSAFEERITLIYPEPTGSLLAGLLTGSRSGLPQRIHDAFRRTGLSHIVAISGSNITIILGIMTHILFFLPKRYKLIPSVIGIALFTLFVGGSASVVRAAIMGSIGLLAVTGGRLPHARLATLWTAFFMLLWNPLQLWYDAGFQLSFLAVIGLIELQPILTKLCERVPEFGGIREALLTTIAAQCTTTAWSAYAFGQFSLIAPIANILTTPFIPLAMLFGFIGSIIGWVVPILGKLIGFPAFLILTYIIRTAETLAKVPYAAAELDDVSPWVIVAYYGGLIVFVQLWKRHGSSSSP